MNALLSVLLSFDLRPMDQASAIAALQRGELVAIITLPEEFSYAIAHGEETTIHALSLQE